MLTITIDNRAVEASPGATLLEVARAAGIAIPTLCHHPRLAAKAVCRICAVELVGAPKPVTACNTTARDGMVVRTDAPALLAARRAVVELLLADGQHDCAVCHQESTCELRTAARALGIEQTSLPSARRAQPIDDSHPAIRFDPNHCIRCWRCVQGCNETVVNECLGVGGRGSKTRVIRDDGASLGDSSCVGCGECAQLCPTGALSDKSLRIAPERLESVATTCPYCGVGCQLEVAVDRSANRIAHVKGREGALPNDGSLCVKGRFGFEFVASNERLCRPLLKHGDELEPVSWEAALDHTATRLAKIRDRFGPAAISAAGSARDTNENNYALMKLMRAAIRTNNIDHCART